MGSVAQSCPTLCDPMNYSPPDSSIHGIFQARILEWVAIPYLIHMNKTDVTSLFIKTKGYLLSKCPQTGECTDKIWYIRTKKHYKQKWITNIWMNFDYCIDELQPHYAQWKRPVTTPYILWLHLYEISKKGKAIETVDSRDGVGVGERILTVNEPKRFHWGDKNVLNLINGNGCTTW